MDRIFTKDVLDDISKAIKPMLNNRLENYIIPGLASSLVGGGNFGKVRLFSTDREARDFVTPHSHRFDFTCIVLSGLVRNTIFFDEQMMTGDMWCQSTIDQVCGADGIRNYVHRRDDNPSRWNQDTQTYEPGDTYSMTYDQIHSIYFARGSQVIFFEGPELTSSSRMIEPWVNGKVVPTFKTEEWMFNRVE